MADLLISDTSVLIDLERGNLLQATFKLPTPLAVPDVLYDRELRETNGPLLLTLGLQVLTLNDAGVGLAQTYMRRDRRLSVPDAFAVALAKAGNHVLVCGDQALRTLAESESVECHGLLWVLDQMVAADLVPIRLVRTGLETIANHPRCRLSRELVARHMAKLSR